MAYQVPETAEERLAELKKHLEIYQNDYETFKTANKKSAGMRAKKALTVVKKLITPVRGDIQREVDSIRKV